MAKTRPNPEQHPAGTRLLWRPRTSYHTWEVTVVEWSPAGRAKLRHESGAETWEDIEDVQRSEVLEVLPGRPTAESHRGARPQSPGLQALHDRFVGDDPERIASYERALADAQVEESISHLRDQLQVLLAAYESDEPHWGPEEGADSQSHYPTFTPDQFAAMLREEHHGDCCGQPGTCPRCWAERIAHKADWIASRIGVGRHEASHRPNLGECP